MADPHPNPSTPPALPQRDPAGHKGNFGTTLIVGGTTAQTHDDHLPIVMAGGPALAAGAALRAGAGLAQLALPAPLVPAALAITPEATAIALPTDDLALAATILHHAASHASALLVGPGLGQNPTARALTRAALDSPCPALVFDADSLNALTATTPPPDRLGRPDQTIFLTPHRGEFNRLAHWLGLADPAAIAERLRVVLIVKSADTLIVDGTTGTPAPTHLPGQQPLLATGGSGDVLAGILTGLVAQWVAASPESPITKLAPATLAAIAVRGHQRAAAFWAERVRSELGGDRPISRGMVASDLLPWIGPALEAAAEAPR